MGDTTVTSREARHRLYEIMRRDVSFEEKAREALGLGEQYLGADNGHLARVDPETDYWEATVSTDPPDGLFPPGLELELGETYCRCTIAGDDPINAAPLTSSDGQVERVIMAITDTTEQRGRGAQHDEPPTW